MYTYHAVLNLTRFHLIKFFNFRIFLWQSIHCYALGTCIYWNSIWTLLSCSRNLNGGILFFISLSMTFHHNSVPASLSTWNASLTGLGMKTQKFFMSAILIMWLYLWSHAITFSMNVPLLPLAHQINADSLTILDLQLHTQQLQLDLIPSSALTAFN